MAEEVGFEPTLPGIPVKQFSRLPPSTTRPPLRMGRVVSWPDDVISRRAENGGEMGIRTPDTLLAHTRFPIVLLRPARTSLRFAYLHINRMQRIRSILQQSHAYKRNFGDFLSFAKPSNPTWRHPMILQRHRKQEARRNLRLPVPKTHPGRTARSSLRP